VTFILPYVTSQFTARRKDRPELAGGKRFEGAEAGGEFGGSEAAFAVQGPQQVRRRPLSLLRIAFQTAGNQVPIRIPPRPAQRPYMVQTPHSVIQPFPAVKAKFAISRKNRLSQRPRPHEIHFLDVWHLRDPWQRPHRPPQLRNLIWQPHFYCMALFAPAQQPQSPERHESSYRISRRSS